MAHPKLKDPAAVEAAVEAYFKRCEDSREIRELRSGDIRIREEAPCVIGLVLELGIDKATFYRYLSGETNTSAEDETQQQIRDTLARARDRIELHTVHAAANGDMEPRTAALLLSSYGYNKPPETEATVTVRIAGNDGDAKHWSE